MHFSTVVSAVFICGRGISLATFTANSSTLSTPSKPGLEWTRSSSTIPLLTPAFMAKIDWDLNNNHTVETQSGLRISIWGREGYWYDVEGRQFGEIVRATDDGIIPHGTNYLELRIYYVIKLDDGFWAYVKHTGGAILRQTQNGVVRVETASFKYNWLNLIDFVAPGTFNGTEIMTVQHYFPNRG
ncbi:hypothetical protein P153DRAFT_386061 [Dothidotthia symphoricarpi CBS 119687]|uniref:Uncharacterized protein n=1 Tax=Dothidotthia symphoricarpi CBS 119687 TaxID=1392245 RepID=A0A6A6AAP1_9PLEO|nr:uncharacterized protein P153DRAFT_386061 [Dothidotthia symphoricarpi CBS 119687]KAF2128859.1 hypothetical protein P153DRAFT_386061 [Dothidotthia symphoricarpi CBS 119687]